MASEVVLICGFNCFSWHELFKVAQRYTYHRDKNSVYNKYHGLTIYRTGFHQCLNTRLAIGLARLKYWQKSGCELHPAPLRICWREDSECRDSGYSTIYLPILLSYTWKFQAIDPKDKILALKFFVRLEHQQQIIVDYFRSVKDVFIIIAPIFLKGSKQEVLKEAETNLNREGLEPLEDLSFIQNHSIWKTFLPETPICLPGFPSSV